MFRTVLPTTMLAAALALAGCGDEPPEAAQEAEQRDASAQGHASDAGKAQAGDARARSDARERDACVLPPDCKGVHAPGAFDVEACCSAAVECGFRVPDTQAQLGEAVTNAIDPEREFKDGCIPRERYFLRFPGLMDERVPVEGAEDILIAEVCEQSAILSISFPGCCMPDGRCGLSNYQFHDTFAVVVGDQAELAQLQCVPSETMNAYIRETSMAGFAYLPASRGRCDYAALDARLPPAESPLADP